jgi:hypothetical protein
MRSKYEILLNVKIDHDYYNDDSFQGLELIPHPKTEKFFRNYKLLFKRQLNSYYILQEGLIEGDVWSPLIEIDIQKELVFLFKCNDEMFQMKTEGEFFANKDRKMLIQLSKGDSELQFLPFKKAFVFLDNSSNETSSVFALKKSSQEEELNYEVEKGESKSIRPELEGKMELSKNGVLDETFILNDFDDQFDGMALYELSNELGQNVEFTFNARKISWEYTLQFKYLDPGSNISSLDFKEENGDILFELVEKDGKYLFCSTTEIKLQKALNYSMYIEIDGEKEFINIGAPSLKNIGKSSKLVDKLVLVEHITV